MPNAGGGSNIGSSSQIVDEIITSADIKDGEIANSDISPTAAIALSKLANVSATSRALGRKTAGAGAIEELTLSELLDFIGSAAQGDILFRGAAGWQRLGTGTLGQYLKSGGAAADLAWDTLATGPTVVKKTADETVNNVNNVQVDDHLVFAMAANTNYRIRLFIIYTTPAAADFKWTIGNPGAPTTMHGYYVQTEGSTAPAVASVNGAYPANINITGAGTQGFMELNIIVQNAGVAGDFDLRWAQGTATVGDTTVHAGSFIEYSTI